MELAIDISDWEAEARQAEADMSTKDKAIQSRIEQQMHPAKAGRIYIVARELGMADPEMLSPNKSMLMVGAAYEWSQMEAHEYQRIRLTNGKEIKVRALVHPVIEDNEVGGNNEDEPEQLDFEIEGIEEPPDEPPDDNPAPVNWDDPLAVNRARAYIMQKGIGHLYGRFKIIAANEGDVWASWRAFSDKMEGLLAGLV